MLINDLFCTSLISKMGDRPQHTLMPAHRSSIVVFSRAEKLRHLAETISLWHVRRILMGVVT